jgi:DNA-directed RNA polymerase omega subunit
MPPAGAVMIVDSTTRRGKFCLRGRSQGTVQAMKKTSWNTFSSIDGEGQRPEVDSVYRLIVVAALRNKQLARGASPRIEANPQRRRNTSIAIEEVKTGSRALHHYGR